MCQKLTFEELFSESNASEIKKDNYMRGYEYFKTVYQDMKSRNDARLIEYKENINWEIDDAHLLVSSVDYYLRVNNLPFNENKIEFNDKEAIERVLAVGLYELTPHDILFKGLIENDEENLGFEPDELEWEMDEEDIEDLLKTANNPSEISQEVKNEFGKMIKSRIVFFKRNPTIQNTFKIASFYNEVLAQKDFDLNKFANDCTDICIQYYESDDTIWDNIEMTLISEMKNQIKNL